LCRLPSISFSGVKTACSRRLFCRGRAEEIIEPDDDAAGESRVDKLTRELASAINESEATDRPEMREYAIEMLRDTVSQPVPKTEMREPGARPAPLNPLAFGIPLIAVGFILALVFPPVGLALMTMGLLAVLAGVLLAMGRSVRERFRSDKPG
jgi:hypothetical protein